MSRLSRGVAKRQRRGAFTRGLGAGLFAGVGGQAIERALGPSSHLPDWSWQTWFWIGQAMWVLAIVLILTEPYLHNNKPEK
jgi:hypothetical protein